MAEPSQSHGGLTVIRPYINRSPNSSGSLPVIQPYFNKSKGTFLTLPQELRDRAYSFLLPRPRKRTDLKRQRHRRTKIHAVIQLAKSCHIIRRDLAKAFWSKAKFGYHHCGDARTIPLSQEHLRLVTDLVVSLPTLIDNDFSRAACIVRLSKAGICRTLRLHDRPRFCCDTGRNPMTAEARETLERKAEEEEREETRALIQPQMDKAERILKEAGCVTFEVLEALCDGYDH